MKKLAILAAIAALAMAAPAAATPLGWYAGAGYSHFDDGADIGAVTGRLGYQITPAWGAEGEVSTGLNREHGVKLDNAVGVFGTGTIPVVNRLDAFARLGYERINYSGHSSDGSTDGIAFGGGLKYQLNDRFGIRGEYTRVGGDTDVNDWALSGVVSF